MIRSLNDDGMVLLLTRLLKSCQYGSYYLVFWSESTHSLFSCKEKSRTKNFCVRIFQVPKLPQDVNNIFLSFVMPKICEGYKNCVNCESFAETTIWSCGNSWKTVGEVFEMFMADNVWGVFQLRVEVEDRADAQICPSRVGCPQWNEGRRWATFIIFKVFAAFVTIDLLWRKRTNCMIYHPL